MLLIFRLMMLLLLDLFVVERSLFVGGSKGWIENAQK